MHKQYIFSMFAMLVKRIIAYFLIVIMLFGQTGYLFHYLIMRHNMFVQMRTELTKNKSPKNTCIIEVANNSKEIIWEEKNEEFQFKNKLYDVIGFQCNGKTVKYYCITDDNETNLVNNFIKQSENQHKGKSGIQLIKSLVFLAENKPNLINTNSFLFPSNIIYNQFPNKSHIACVLDLAIPPPKSNYIN